MIRKPIFLLWPSCLSFKRKKIRNSNETDIAVANAETIGYSTPHTEAKKELDPEIVNNPNFYPPEEVLARTEIFLTLPDEVNRLMDDLWIQIKNG